jgi:hypothetical protein
MVLALDGSDMFDDFRRKSQLELGGRRHSSEL